jgi:hypothetical protein
MNIFRFEPNEPTGVHRLNGITVDPNLVPQSHSNAPVLLFLNDRDVLTVFPVALMAAPNLNLEELHGVRTSASDDAGNGQGSLEFIGPEQRVQSFRAGPNAFEHGNLIGERADVRRGHQRLLPMPRA